MGNSTKPDQEGRGLAQVAYIRDEELNFEGLVMEDAGNTFEIQRSLTIDDQDRALGWDTYCLVLGGGPTFYGGVLGWHLSEDHLLHLSLSQEAAAELGLPGTRFAFPVGGDGAQAVRAHLARLLTES